MDLGTFRFETEKALSSICLSDTVYKFSVDGELHRSVDSDNHVAIPFPLALAAHLIGHTSVASRILGNSLHPARAKQLSADVT